MSAHIINNLDMLLIEHNDIIDAVNQLIENKMCELSKYLSICCKYRIYIYIYSLIICLFAGSGSLWHIDGNHKLIRYVDINLVKIPTATTSRTGHSASGIIIILPKKNVP